VVIYDTIRVLQPPIDGLEDMDVGDVEGVVEEVFEEEDSFSTEENESREDPDDKLEVHESEMEAIIEE
jgi:hypothetical protein